MLEGVTFWLCVLFPFPPLAVSPRNNQTVLEHGTVAKGKLMVAQLARRLVQK